MKVNPKFSYNPQDPVVMEPHSKELKGVQNRQGIVSTDKVELRGYNVRTFMGRPISTRRDRKLKLQANRDGQYVFPSDQKNFTVANTFVAAADTVKTFEERLKRHTGKEIEWAFPDDKLGVSPTSGDWKNAYYARDKGALFLFSFETQDGKKSSSGNSGEIVAHEAGHAILDAVRPNWNRTNSIEIRAFHESFGDMLATLMSLKDEKVLARLVEETGGDLRGGPKSKKNMVSEMGEELGNQVGIRSAYNDFRYQNPSELPNRGNESQLGREAHDFSRLFSGAFYEILDGISDKNRAEGQSPTEALRSAADEGWTMLVGMLENSPTSGGDFRRLAQAMVSGDQEFNGGQRKELLLDVFTKRKILSSGKNPMTIVPSDQEPNRLLGSDFGRLEGVQIRETSEADVRLLQEDNDILYTKPGDSPEVGDFIKDDGSAYSSYLVWGKDGQAELLPSPYLFD